MEPAGGGGGARGSRRAARLARLGTVLAGALALLALLAMALGARSAGAPAPDRLAAQAALAPVPVPERLALPRGSVERPELRTRTSRTYARPDGILAAEVGATSVNYADEEGLLRPIDNTLSRTPAGIQNAANRYRARLPLRHGAAPVLVESKGRWVRFSLEGGQGAPAVTDGARATYAGVLPGIDLEYIAGNDMLAEKLTLQSAEAQSRFTYRIELSPGLRAESLPSGAIAFRDETGAALMGFAPPYLQDASGTPAGFSRQVAVSLEDSAGGYRLTYAADRAWLEAPERVYPVVLDPTVVFDVFFTVEPGVDRDCYIADQQFQNINGCGFSENYVSFDGTTRARTLMRFELDEAGVGGNLIPQDAQVLSAQLVATPAGPATGGLINLHALTQAWNATATWNNRVGSTPWTTPGGSFRAGAEVGGGELLADGTYSWAPTALVQEWVSGATTNNGLLLKLADESRPAGIAMYSGQDPGGRWPRLVVHYRPAPIGALASDQFFEEALTDRTSAGVNLVTGNLLLSSSDVAITGTGLDLTLARSYNSRSLDTNLNLGTKWVLSAGLDIGLIAYPSGEATLIDGDGLAAVFHRLSDGSFRSPPGLNATLVADREGTGTLTFNRSGDRYRFEGGTLSTHRDRNGNVNTYSYSDPAQPKLESIIDSQARTTTLDHDANGRVTRITDPAGRIFAYAYDAAGKLVGHTDPEGGITSYSYDPSGDLIQVIHPRGTRTLIDYDGRRRVLSLTRVANPATSTGPTTTFAYDDLARTTTLTDPNGHQTLIAHNQEGLVSAVTDALGNRTETAYNANHDPTIVRSPRGGSVSYSYSADGRFNPIGSVLSSGATSGAAYGDPDHPFLPSSAIDPRGNQTGYAYDGPGNLTRLTSLPAQTTLAYNTDGTLASATDANGVQTTYVYSAPGNLQRINNPAPLGTETFAYDPLSRLTQATDGAGRTTQRTYDGLDRLTRIDYGDGSGVQLAYDANGNLLSRTEAAGTTTYTYDLLDRLLREDLPGGEVNQYAYDPAGNLTEITTARGTVSYAYDAAGRPLSVIEPGGATTTFTHDADGNRTLTGFPNGVQQAESHDLVGRLTRIGATRAGTSLTEFAYDYDAPDGTDTLLRHQMSDLQGRTSAYTYDTLGRLTRARVTGASGAELEDYQYAYDPAGNRMTQDVDGTLTSYSYNDANQLTTAAGTSYAYDGAGGLTSSSAGLALAYNAKGQTTSITAPGGPLVGFDYLGPGQSERTRHGARSLINDALGLGSQVSGGDPTHFTRDPGGGLIAQHLPNGDEHYYLSDGLGSVVALSGASGTLEATYRYDPFGNTIAETGSVANPYRFAGEYRDATGLYKIGERYYDPELGRWTQLDPAGPGYAGGDPEPYAYSANNPVNFRDPTGLRTVFACSLGVSNPRQRRISAAVLGVGFSVCSLPVLFTTIQVCVQRQVFGAFYANVRCARSSGRGLSIVEAQVRAPCRRRGSVGLFRVAASATTILSNFRAGRNLVYSDETARFRCNPLTGR